MYSVMPLRPAAAAILASLRKKERVKPEGRGCSLGNARHGASGGRVAAAQAAALTAAVAVQWQQLGSAGWEHTGLVTHR